tara:strand:- start:619 stop:1461 length:843 start_codon:yes stop_codon:yes gene_type:complete
MSSCWTTIQDYGLRSLGIGERILPKTDITMCEQIVLIGSGLIWNIYFGLIAVFLGFWFAIFLAIAKNSNSAIYRIPAISFIFLFRGSPLFIQFFFAYELFVLLPKLGITLDLGFVTLTAETRWLTRAWLGGLIVLFCNTAAYSAEIFYGAMRSVSSTELEAAEAFGITGRKKFWRIIWPSMLRLAWPSYTNEAIFLFHATALIFFSGFPAWRQSGDALYYASYFADKTFNPFIPYPIVAAYFISVTLIIILVFGAANSYLNRHLDIKQRPKLKLFVNLLR